MNKKVLWITRTGLFVALLVTLQWVTGTLTSAAPPPFNTLVTGSVVNLILIVSVMTCGLASGAAVAVLSPVMAFIMPIPIGPQFPAIIPLICFGNLALVILWSLIGNCKIPYKYLAYVIALVVGAVGKFLVLYIGVVKIVAPLILDLPPAAPIYVMFSYPQLITASIGGALAILVLPILNKAINKN
ncbi:MAG: hypothetical protein FWH08_03220 [Oscillospiraceae bacterium]|nr:hypothetical protein [Oscillospiraceae bacterium]